MAVLHLTREGYEKIKDELNYLIQVKRKEIANALEHARGFGDLKENAEYDAAKNAQALNEAKIRELSGKLGQAQILDDSKIDKNKAYIGATLQLQDMESGEELSYMLVSDAEADFLEDKISVNSPIGKALLGHERGDEIDIQVPAGTLKYKLLDITR